MSKLIFIADTIIEQRCQAPIKIMNLYMNRLAIDENEANEVIAVSVFSFGRITRWNLDEEFFITNECIDNPLDNCEEIKKTAKKVSENEFIHALTKNALDSNHLVQDCVNEFLYLAAQFENTSSLEDQKDFNCSLPIHLIYSGNSFNWTDIIGHNIEQDVGPHEFSRWLVRYVQWVLECLEIDSIYLTFLEMWKHNLVTTETAERCFKQEYRSKDGGIMESVNDDILNFQVNLTRLPETLLGRKPTYFLPKKGFMKKDVNL